MIIGFNLVFADYNEMLKQSKTTKSSISLSLDGNDENKQKSTLDKPRFGSQFKLVIDEPTTKKEQIESFLPSGFDKKHYYFFSVRETSLAKNKHDQVFVLLLTAVDAIFFKNYLSKKTNFD